MFITFLSQRRNFTLNAAVVILFPHHCCSSISTLILPSCVNHQMCLYRCSPPFKWMAFYPANSQYILLCSPTLLPSSGLLWMMDRAVSLQVVITSVAQCSLYPALLMLACTQIGPCAVCLQGLLVDGDENA